MLDEKRFRRRRAAQFWLLVLVAAILVVSWDVAFGAEPPTCSLGIPAQVPLEEIEGVHISDEAVLASMPGVRPLTTHVIARTVGQAVLVLQFNGSCLIHFGRVPLAIWQAAYGWEA